MTRIRDNYFRDYYSSIFNAWNDRTDPMGLQYSSMITDEAVDINNIADDKDNQFMRRTIDKGALVKVISKPDVFFDLDEKVKELGGTSKWTGKYIPKIGEVGDVMGVDEGYILINFEGGEALLDMSCLEPQKRKNEVQFLVKYPSGALEEYSSEKEIEKRMQDLYKAQNLKPGEVIKVYNVEGYREVKVKIEIAFT